MMRRIRVPIFVAVLVVGLSGCQSPVRQAGEDLRAAPQQRTGNATTQESDLARLALRKKRAKLIEAVSQRFDQPKEAEEFFLRQRLAPGMTKLPLEHLQAESVKLRAREAEFEQANAGGLRVGGITTWTELGPQNIGGRTRTIVIDPTNPDIMYTAGVTGGIWKSFDGGQSWQIAADLLPNLAVSTLAMDPTNANVLYAGTGEGFFGDATMHRGLGIYKTVDAGATWDLLDATTSGVPAGAFHFVNKIVISPHDPGRIYAATMTGVWRSQDAGQSWSVVLRNPWRLSSPAGIPATQGSAVGCTDLAIRPNTATDVLFAAFGSFSPDGLYRSDDGGDNWVAYQTAPEQGRMTIAIAPSDPNRMYILMAQNGSGSLGKLYSVFRSDNGGDSWTSSLDFGHPFSEWLLSYVAIATGCYEHPVIYSQGWYDNIIAVDPVDPDIVWVGGIDMYRSDDGGQTFGLTEYWFYNMQDPPPPVYLHPDNHVIAFHPAYDGVTNQIMYVGNDGGLFRTTNARAATTQEECPIGPEPGPPPEIAWENLNHGYGVTQFYHGDSAKERDMFAGGSQDNGTSRALSAGAPNGWKRIYGGDGGYVAIDPTNSQHMFVEIQGFPQIRVSYDSGATFEWAANGITDNDGLFITPVAMDQNDPAIMWTGGQRPWRTKNGAGLWSLSGPDFPGLGQISAIGIAPSDSRVVYLGFNDGYIARTTSGLDASPSWSVGATGLVSGAWVSSIAVDPHDPDKAYLTYSNYGIAHVRRTLDGGTTWTSIDGSEPAALPDIPAHWIAVRPCDPEQLYVGTELGVFASDDGGASWEPANTGLPHAIVETLDFKDSHTLVAFTHGRGAFIAELEPCLSCFARDGDLNGDGDVNLSDHEVWVGCCAGPSGQRPGFCDPCDFTNSDLDGDGDVDLRDYALLQAMTPGPP